MDIWGGGGAFILLWNSEILQAPKPLPTARFLKILFLLPLSTSSGSCNCFCTSFLSIPQKNSTALGASYVLAPPSCWDWGGEKPQNEISPARRVRSPQLLRVAAGCNHH